MTGCDHLPGVNPGVGRFVVISGCSGNGKSTLIAELGRRGHTVVEAPGRRIVREELKAEGSALPWIDETAFARRRCDSSRRPNISRHARRLGVLRQRLGRHRCRPSVLDWRAGAGSAWSRPALPSSHGSDAAVAGNLRDRPRAASRVAERSDFVLDAATEGRHRIHGSGKLRSRTGGSLRVLTNR